MLIKGDAFGGDIGTIAVKALLTAVKISHRPKVPVDTHFRRDHNWRFCQPSYFLPQSVNMCFQRMSC